MRSSTMSLFTLSLIFLLIFYFFHGANSQGVNEACSIATVGHEKDYIFCVASLSAAPGINNITNIKELGVVLVQLTLSNATHNYFYINSLLGEKILVHEKQLKDCLFAYQEVIKNLEPAIGAVISEDFRRAIQLLSASKDLSTQCEDGFKKLKKGLVSPLAKQSSDFYLLASLTETITTYLN